MTKIQKKELQKLKIQIELDGINSQIKDLKREWKKRIDEEIQGTEWSWYIKTFDKLLAERNILEKVKE